MTTHTYLQDAYALFNRVGDVLVDGVPLRDHTIEDVSVFHLGAQQILTEAKKYCAGEWQPLLGGNPSFKSKFVPLVFCFVSILSVPLIWRRSLVVFGMEAATGTGKRDFRMEPLWEVIDRRSVRATSMLHVVPSKKTALRALRRGLPTLYLEAFDLFFKSTRKSPVIDASLYSPEEAQFIEDLVPRLLHLAELTRFRARVWGVLLKLIGPRRMVLIDDGRHHHGLIWACERARVPTTLYQHGHYTKYHVGVRRHQVTGRHLVPSQLIVWSDYWKEVFMELGGLVPEHQISVACKKPLMRVAYDPTAPVLVPFESEGARKEMGEMLKALGEKAVFKLRTDVGETEQLVPYGLSKTDVVTVTQVPQVISGAVGMYSTLLYDLVAAGIPVGVCTDLSDFGEGLVLTGLGEAVSHNDVPGMLALLATVDQAIRTRRKMMLTACSGDLDSVMESW